jgi:GLPGLI family protein
MNKFIALGLLLFVGAFLFNGVEAQTISGKISYRYVMDSSILVNALNTYQEKYPENYATYGPLMREAADVAGNIEYSLAFNAEESMFRQVRDASSLSALNPLVVNMAASFSGLLNRDFYLNTAKRTRLFETVPPGSSDVLQVKQAYEMYDWNITGKQKVIGKYQCQEAITDTGGKVLMAYFTSQIPFPYGPANADGLPGVILELCIGIECKAAYRAQEINLTTESSADMISLRKPRRIFTEAEYLELMATQGKSSRY